jgi:hypothetical protein
VYSFADEDGDSSSQPAVDNSYQDWTNNTLSVEDNSHKQIHNNNNNKNNNNNNNINNNNNNFSFPIPRAFAVSAADPLKSPVGSILSSLQVPN